MATQNDTDLDILAFEPARTVPELFYERAARDPDALAYREFHDGRWVDHTWRHVAQKVGQIRAALDRAGLASGDRVGILLRNCVDWVAFDIAAMANGLVTVPVYLHDGPANTSYVLAQSGVRLCLMDTQERWQSLGRQFPDRMQIETVWIHQPPDRPLQDTERRVERFRDVLSGDGIGAQDIRCSAHEVATIIHTSGTTGLPKGVMLSHRALLWNADAVMKFVPVLKSDVFLSVLPLAHAFERTVGYHAPLASGACVVFVRSVETLREDMATVRPTILIGVAKLYERIQAAIVDKASSNPISRSLTMLAADIGWRLFEATHGRGARPGLLTRALLWPILQRLVVRKVLQAFGGRLRVAVCGGAPLDEEASHFLIGMGLPLIEGYGLTEAAPVVTGSTLEQSLPGSVGVALDGVELKILETGELLVRSPALMLGYWNDPQTTAQAIDREGWLHTGDIAELRDDHVFIRGRLKEILALSTGKKVAPSLVEALIEREPLFDQAIAIGDGRPCLAAIVVINREAWARLSAERGLPAEDPNTPAATKALLSIISQSSGALPGYARVRAVHAVFEPWTTGNGLLTPTLKVKRAAVESRFEHEIETLYANLKAARTARKI